MNQIWNKCIFSFYYLFLQSEKKDHAVWSNMKSMILNQLYSNNSMMTTECLALKVFVDSYLLPGYNIQQPSKYVPGVKLFILHRTNIVPKDPPAHYVAPVQI